jgi:hypothetical protein
VKKVLFAIAICVSTLSAARAAETDGSLIGQYGGLTSGGLVECRLVMRVALARMAAGDSAEEALNDGNGADGKGNWKACIDRQRAGEFKTYLELTRLLKRRPATLEALKTYHVAWATALAGIAPAFDERRMDYARRQSDADMRVSEAWERLRLEVATSAH